MQIAIDGPAGAGKSTIARLLAIELGFPYLDTGAMYRAATLLALRQGTSPADAESVTEIARSMDLGMSFDRDSSTNRVFIGNEDVTQKIRQPEIDLHVSVVSCHEGVRSALVDKQRQLAAEGDIILDGRDVGTTVLPDADIKLFITATPRERARRRAAELISKGYRVDEGELEKQIRERDAIDSTREISPLIKAEDAVEIETTGLSIPEVVRKALDICQGGLERV